MKDKLWTYQYAGSGEEYYFEEPHYKIINLFDNDYIAIVLGEKNARLIVDALKAYALRAPGKKKAEA